VKNPRASIVPLEKGEHKYLLARPKNGNIKSRHRIVFVHGMAGHAAYFKPMMGYFASRGYKCYAPDIEGHGERHHVDISGKFIKHYVADVGHFTDTVVSADGDGPIIYVGHSMGGLIAAKKSEKRSDVSGVVLITPAPPRGVLFYPTGLLSLTLNDVLGFGKMLQGEHFVPSRRLLESLFADPIASKKVIDMWESRRVSNESFFVMLQLGLTLVGVNPDKINSPMLVIGAKKDKIVHHRVAERVATHFGAEYHSLEHLGHMCPFESGWEETAGIIDAWLKKKGLDV
jgi:alpha-beta hydrolase superfamily lysophospholipase